jgi:hypothetical protein
MNDVPEFTEREIRLIKNCRTYVQDDPAGLPGHNLMIIIKKFADLLDANEIDIIVEGSNNE